MEHSFTHEEIPIDFDPKWIKMLERLKNQFGKKPNLEAILFLIGINELGAGSKKFTKEQKQDLMHIAVCKLLSYEGLYFVNGYDKDGWPRWEITSRLPHLTNAEQEILLKKNIIRYFDEN